MIYLRNKKKLIQNTKVLWLFVVLFLGSFLFGGNSLAVTHDYNKQPNGTLEAAEWNLLPTDFVNTWATSTMVGPLGIGTAGPQANLDIYRATDGTYFRGGSSNIARQLRIFSSATTADGDTHTFDAMSGLGNLAFAITGSEKMRIITSGNIGIGTTTPNNLFQVYGGTGQVVSVSGGQIGGLNSTPINSDQAVPLGYLQANYLSSAPGSSAGWLLSGNAIPDDNSWLGATSNHDIAFKTNNTERMRILKGGNVGIGTVTPATLLNLYSTNPIITLTRSDNATTPSAAINFNSVGTTRWQLGTNQSSGAGLEINEGNGVNPRLYVATGGNVGIGTTNPLYKFQVVNEGAATFAGFSTYSSVSAANRPIFYFTRGRGTQASPVAINSGDTIGSIYFAGQKNTTVGTDGIVAGSGIEVYASENWSGSANGSYMTFWTSPTGSYTSGGNEAMRILGSGNVGIGTTDPGVFKLNVNGGGYFANSVGVGVTPSAWASGTENVLQVKNAGLYGYGTYESGLMTNAYYNSGWKYISTDTANLYQQTAGAHIWSNAISGTAGNAIPFTERMRITSGGNVGIGTTTPNTLFQVYGGTGQVVNVSGGQIGGLNSTPLNSDQAVPLGYLQANYLSSAPSSSAGWLLSGNSVASDSSWLGSIGNYDIAFKTNNTERIRILKGGNVGIGTTAPGAKLDIGGGDVSTLQAILARGNSDGNFKLSVYNGAGNAISTEHAWLGMTYGTTKLAGISFFRGSAANAYMQFQTGAAAATAMTIDSTGNVGVGTTGPTDKLGIGGITSGYGIRLATGAATNSGIQLYTGAVDNHYWGIQHFDSNDRLGINFDGGEKVTVLSSGNVGIGTTTPNNLFQVYGGTGQVMSVSGGQIGGLNSTPLNADQAVPLGYLQANYSPTSGNLWSGTLNGTIYNGTAGAGNVGIGTTTPNNTYQGLTIYGSNPSLSLAGNGPSSWNWIQYMTSAGVNNFSSGVNQAGYYGIVAGAGMDNPTLSINSAKDVALGNSFNGLTFIGATMVVRAAGNVGIGTTNPSNKLDVEIQTTTNVNGTVVNSYPIVDFTNLASGGGSRGLQIGAPTGSIVSPVYLKVNGTSARFSILNQNDVENFTILEGGNVGIGTTTPNNLFQVYGGTGQVMSVSGGQIGGLNSTPLNADQAVPLGYLQANYSPTSGNLWSGTLNGTIYNGTAGAGNVGIGTTTPVYPLDVNNRIRATGEIVAKGNGIIGDVRMVQGSDTNTGYISWQLPYADGATPGARLGYMGWSATNVALTLQNSANFVVSGGNVGIGTTAPGEKLSVEGAGTANENIARFNNQGGYASRIWLRNSSRSAYFSVSAGTADTIATDILPYSLSMGLSGNPSPIQFFNGTSASVKMTINTTGNVGIGTTTPNNLFQVYGGTGQVMSVSGGQIGGLNSVPLNADQAVPLGYLQANYSPTAGNLWSGTLNGTIYNGTAGAGNVGIGTTSPLAKLHIYSASGYGQIITEAAGGNFLTFRTTAAPASDTWTQFIDSSNGFNFYSSQSPAGTKLTINTAGNVGIGTTNPATLLHVRGTGSDTSTYNSLRLDNPSVATAGTTNGLLFYWNTIEAAKVAAVLESPSTWNTGLALYTATGMATATEKVRITSGGNVGIGTTDPGVYKLKVAGDVGITGTLQTQMGSDFAEEFATTDNLEPGTVVVMDDHGYKSVRPCTQSYDKTVVGIVSNNPSIIAGRVESEHKAIIAMMGVVKVKVTSSNGAISKGDLLTSSSRTGFAMKAINNKQGTIIGKALEDLNSYQGEINVLVNLQ